MYINHCGSFADRTEGSQLCDKKYILIPIVIFDIWQFLNKLCNSLNNWHEHFRVYGTIILDYTIKLKKN